MKNQKNRVRKILTLLQYIYLKKSEHHEHEIVNKTETGEPEEHYDHWILCALCQNHITKWKSQTLVNNKTEHTFTNPQGLLFAIKCYREAPGCKSYSRPTEEFTWFPGYAWEIVVCSSCNTHLGWKYSKQDHNFFGLIHKKLIEN